MRYPNATIDMIKFRKNMHIRNALDDAFSNGTFGGNIFQPLIVNGIISKRVKPGMEKLDGGGFAECRRNGMMKELFELRN